ncbi:hypothetical protein [Deinococcus hopiensis]|uniref:hypothetical protein n=1 Tax=Deinococcus hopiensis TaxID=309885 RepID=UPI001BAEA57C|nr:hypothetical protein [Deinococcus hopiensis]
MLHYAPTAATVEGEPPEIFPFLGTPHLETPLTRGPVADVFHGHAHAGTFRGQLSNGTPVFNVALPLMRRLRPDAPYHLLEIQPEEAGRAEGWPPAPDVRQGGFT